MTIKHLKIFVEVYKENSITEAAKKLDIAQPAASLAIHELETYYNIKFFERKGRGIQKNNYAEEFYQYASHIVSLYSQLDNEFKNIKSSETLTIGSSSTVGICLLPQLISGYLKLNKAAMPYVKIDSSDIIEKMVLDNKLDCGLMEGNIHFDELLCEPVANDELSLICSLSHPLAIYNTISVNELKEQNFIMREKTNAVRKIVDAAFMLHNFSLQPLWESTSSTAIINAVIANIGLSIMPHKLIKPYTKENKLKILTIKDMKLTYNYNIIYHQNKYLTPSILSFFDYIKAFNNNEIF